MEIGNKIVAFVALIVSFICVANGWGIDGHLITCKLAQVRNNNYLVNLLHSYINIINLFKFMVFNYLLQPRLTKAAADAVSQLLPDDDDLASLCSWADQVRFRYPWSSPLHYIDTPDNLCTYQYNSESLLLEEVNEHNV